MADQLLTAALLLVGVLGVGLVVATRVDRLLTLPTATRAALWPLGGVAALGLFTLVIGHVGLLGPWLPWAWAALGVAAAALESRSLRQSAAAVADGVWRQFRATPLSIGAVSLALAVAVIAALAPPNRVDEIQYHWPAPLAWAAAGHWDESPYRHVNGFPFMEVTYTAAATQGGYVAAHLLSLTTLVGLGFAAAGIASSMRLRGVGQVAVAAVCMPVVWGSSYAAYNDTPVGAFATAAVAVALAAVRSGRTMRGAAVAAGLVVIATSIKPTGAAAAGVVALVILLAAHSEHVTWREAFRQVVKPWLVLGAAALGTLAFWSLRQLVISGYLIDPKISGPVSPDELPMLPNATEQALAPLLPLVSGIIGSHEPWGGRTGLGLQLFIIPAIIYVIVRRGSVGRRFATLVVPAWLHWIIVGFAIVRTRFHVISWVLMVAGVRVAVEDFQERRPRLGRWLEWAWTGAVLLSVADVTRDMLQTIRLI